MKKILIIGSNSFSGAHAVNFLLNKNYSILGISRSKEKIKILRPYANNKFVKNFNFLKVDLNKIQKKDIDKIVSFKPTVILNFSAQGMVNESWYYPQDWYKTNILSQVNFLNLIKDKLKIKKYINFTTPEVYGSTPKILKESFNFFPSTPYAISRAAFDLHLFNQFRYFNFPVIFTRTANVFGPYQDLYRIIPVSIMRILKNKKLIIHGKGETIRSFIYIEDVCEALLKIIQIGKVGETYHISTNHFVTIKNLCEKISRINKVKRNLKFVKDRTGKDFAYKLSSQKLRKKLKWKPKNSLLNNLYVTNKWYVDNFTELKKIKLNYEHKK